MKTETVRGDKLKQGDVIRVWWKPGTARIVSIETYTGPLKTLFPEGAVIAQFTDHYAMTIGNHEAFERVVFDEKVTA